jgi:hypothetical protein
LHLQNGSCRGSKGRPGSTQPLGPGLGGRKPWTGWLEKKTGAYYNILTARQYSNKML